MKKALILFGVAMVFCGWKAVAQTPTFSDNIAAIVYSNCTKCHREGGIGPFKLESYQDVMNNGLAIKAAVTAGYMPPWPPDTTYSRFSHERTINSQQINDIATWVDAGMPEGNPSNAPQPPTFSNASELSQTPSVTHRIPTYTITSAQDDYRAFVIQNPATVDQAITEVEFMPGNRKIVHHILMYYDTTEICKQLDDSDPLPGYTAFGGIGNSNAKQVGGWVPGAGPLKLPTNFGMPSYAHGYYVIQIHYAPGSAGMKDSTQFNLVYKPITPTMREVYQLPILNHFTSLSNGPLFVAANQKKKFLENFQLPFPISVLGITPHMHLIGRDKTVWAKKPGQDTLKLIRIKDWNFNWQGQYNFRKMLTLSAGTLIHSESNYDNTASNPYNPNDPPQNVTAGESTVNEMMMTFFAFVSYSPGDENIILDSTLVLEKKGKVVHTELGWRLFPNPTKNELFIVRELLEDGLQPSTIEIMDALGRTVRKSTLNSDVEYLSGTYKLDVSSLRTGVYKTIITSGSKKQIRSFVKE